MTLTGPGGVGKTRLALEVARSLEPELGDGAWFVSLAATASAAHVASAIAQALGVTPLEGETPKLAVERFIALKDGLLVVDNFEHLLAAAPVINDLLAAGPAVTVLATSREPLRLQAEHLYGVGPLQLAAARALFVESARRQEAGFELTESNTGVIAEICQRLDGLPLAIELAAARTGLLGVEELNGRLARGVGCARQRPARCARASANAARNDRLEPPPPERGRTRGLRQVRGVRRRGHDRRRRGGHRRRCRHAAGPGRQAAAPAPPLVHPRRPSVHARDGARVRQRTARRRRARCRDSPAPLRRTTWLWRIAPSQTCSPGARGPGWPSWTPRSRTSGRRWSGASARIRRWLCAWLACSPSSG